MALTELSVIMPTLTGRKESREFCVDAYRQTLAGVDWELITIMDRPSCGAAWQEGAEKARGSYIHFTADDIEPQEGWYAGAREVVDEWEAVPGAVIFRPEGDIESCASWETFGAHKTPADLARIPFCSREQWKKIGPIPPIQYYSDNAFHDGAARNGWPCLIHHEYSFIHHRPRGARPGEGEQMNRDKQTYERWLATR